MAQTTHTEMRTLIHAVDTSISLTLGIDIVKIIVDMISCEKCASPIYGCPKCDDNTRHICLKCHSATCVNCEKPICYEHTVPKVYPFICQGDCFHKRGPSWGWFRKLEERPGFESGLSERPRRSRNLNWSRANTCQQIPSTQLHHRQYSQKVSDTQWSPWF